MKELLEKDVLDIILYIVIMLMLFGGVVLWISNIVKWVKNGFRTEDEIAIEKMMDEEVDKVFTDKNK